MKNIFFSTALGLILLSSSCQQGNESNNKNNQDSVGHPAPEQLSQDNQRPIVFERTRVQGQKDTLSFNVPKPCEAVIQILTEGKPANIRINQLIMPDGQTDGPFGQTWEDSLAHNGTYQLVIGESMMAENPYTGSYRVKVELK